MESVSLPALAAVGVIVGYIAGMFGVGGGFLLTPLLIYVFGIPAPVAVGSALCQKCGTSIASFLKYRDLQRGEVRFDMVMVAGSILGVDAGTRLLAYLVAAGDVRIARSSVPLVDLVLDVLFLLLLSSTAVYTFFDVWRAYGSGKVRGDRTIAGPLAKLRIPPYVDLPHVDLFDVSIPVLAYLGFILGVASGLMGIGGGVLFMPVLLYGFGLSARNAAGTGVLLLFATVVVGTFEQALRGYVSLRLAMAILIGSSVGSQLGALTTHYLPNRVLRLLFAVLLSATSAMIAWNLLKLFGG